MAVKGGTITTCATHFRFYSKTTTSFLNVYTLILGTKKDFHE